MPAARTVSTPLAAQFAISLCWIYVAYSGWNGATLLPKNCATPRALYRRRSLWAPRSWALGCREAGKKGFPQRNRMGGRRVSRLAREGAI